MESKGLGDTVERIIHSTGLDKLAKGYTILTGKDCECVKRKEKLNELFPYKKKE